MPTALSRLLEGFSLAVSSEESTFRLFCPLVLYRIMSTRKSCRLTCVPQDRSPKVLKNCALGSEGALHGAAIGVGGHRQLPALRWQRW